MLSTTFIWFFVELVVAGAVLLLLPSLVSASPIKKYVKLDAVMSVLTTIAVIVLAATLVMALVDTADSFVN